MIVGFATFAYFTTPNASINLKNTNDPFFIIVPIAVFTSVLFGRYVFKKHITNLSIKSTLKEKLKGYRTASFMLYAFFEAPALFSIVVFFLTKNLYFLIIASILTAYYFLQKPTKFKIIQDLNLKGSLKNQFEQENTPIT